MTLQIYLVFQGKAEGRRTALWFRARLQSQLFQLGCFLHRHAGKVLFVAILVLSSFCVGLKSAVIHSRAEQLWVEAINLNQVEADLPNSRGIVASNSKGAPHRYNDPWGGRVPGRRGGWSWSIVVGVADPDNICPDAGRAGTLMSVSVCQPACSIILDYAMAYYDLSLCISQGASLPPVPISAVSPSFYNPAAHVFFLRPIPKICVRSIRSDRIPECRGSEVKDGNQKHSGTLWNTLGAAGDCCLPLPFTAAPRAPPDKVIRLCAVNIPGPLLRNAARDSQITRNMMERPAARAPLVAINEPMSLLGPPDRICLINVGSWTRPVDCSTFDDSERIVDRDIDGNVNGDKARGGAGRSSSDTTQLSRSQISMYNVAKRKMFVERVVHGDVGRTGSSGLGHPARHRVVCRPRQALRYS
ncbi:Protein patched 1 [Homalodisca vitripennis]|nr:Protein patched 1 [Homalodisca vitripennis]